MPILKMTDLDLRGKRVPTAIFVLMESIRTEIAVMGKSRVGVGFDTRSPLACG